MRGLEDFAVDSAGVHALAQFGEGGEAAGAAGGEDAFDGDFADALDGGEAETDGEAGAIGGFCWG